MITRKLIASLMCASALIAVSAPATMASDDKSGENAMAMADGDGGAVAQAAMAHDMFAYAVANKNAVAALAAAQVMMSLGIEDTDREKETQDVEGHDGVEEGEGKDIPADAAAMLAAAKEYAAGDEALLGLIEDVEAEGSRGRIGGASKTLSRLRAGKTDIWKVPFYGGRLAELAILGDGDADLDLVVTDENGNVMCLDRSYSDKLYCSWTPAWDGYFFIGVKNMGRIRNSYYILTN